MTVIRIVAAVVLDSDGRLLLVRKHGTTAFMQPGGKIEPGESAREAVAREVREELGVDAVDIQPLGRHCAAAANEPGHTVDAELFRAQLTGDPAAQAEIDELRWIDPHAPGDVELAPLTRDTVLELVRFS